MGDQKKEEPANKRARIIDDWEKEEEDEKAVVSGYYYETEEEGGNDDADYPAVVRLDFGEESPEGETSFDGLGKMLALDSSYRSFVSGVHEKGEENNGFLDLILAEKFALSSLSSLTTALTGQEFDAVREKLTGFCFAECTLLVDDVLDVEAFCNILGTFPVLRSFSSDSCSWCAQGGGLITNGVPTDADKNLLRRLLPALVRAVPKLNHISVCGLNGDMIVDLCDAMEEKWSRVTGEGDSNQTDGDLPAGFPLSLIAPNSSLSVAACHRIADLMKRFNCFKLLEFADVGDLTDAHAVALAAGVQHSTSLHTLDLHLTSRRQQGITTVGVEAIVSALELNTESILCKLDVSAEEQPEISEELQRRLRKQLIRGCRLARKRVKEGSTDKADKEAAGFMQYAYMPAYFPHEVHEH